MSISQFSKIIKIFYSYATYALRDKTLFDKFRRHLVSFEHEGNIIERYESEISAGSDWHKRIDTFIEEADIIVLLLSADFLASEYSRELEIKRALERHRAGTAYVLSVLWYPTDWEWLQLDEDNLLPQNRKAIAYLRDKDTAFQEIVSRIKKVIEDLRGPFSNGRSHSDGPKFPLRTVPYRRNPFFTGRVEILATLHARFSCSQPSNTLIQVLNGLDGMGKTQTALKYADQYQHEYQAIFWISADSRDLFSDNVTSLADTLALPKRERDDEQALFAAVKRWLQHNQQWLLLIDNINMEDFSLIDQLVPSQCNGHVLMTTHSSATGPFLAITIPPMTRDESVSFLLRRAKRMDNGPPEDYAQAIAIAQEVDGFPLALDQAGAYIEETQSSFGAYLELYRKSRPWLLQKRGQFPDVHPQSVTATFSLAFENISQRNPSAIALLNLFAFLHPDTIPIEMLEDGPINNPLLQVLVHNYLGLDDAIAALLSFSLIYRRADTTTLSIHRIVQDVIKGKLTLDKQREWTSEVVYLVNHVFPEVEFSTWPVCHRYLPQAQRCAEYIASWHFTFPEAAQLLHRLGRYYYERAQYREAETYLARALQIREQELGPMHLDTARSVNALALLYAQQGNYEQAETFQQRALTIYEDIQDIEPADTATIVNNLALLYQEQEKYSLVEPLYHRILAIYTQAYGAEHFEIATTLNNLALLYQKQGKYVQSLPLYLRALTIREHVLEPGHPAIAQSLSNLATLYRDQGKYEEAGPLLLRALTICEQSVGIEHPDTALSLNNLAALYQDQGRYEEAESLYQRALTINEQVLGAEHPDTALSLSNLAMLYRIREKYGAAESLYQRALTIYEQVLGAEHSDTALTLGDLADLYVSQNKYQDAQSLYQRALATLAQTLGYEHPDVATIMKKYAALLEQMQRPEEAANILRIVHSINKKRTDESSEQTM